MYPGHPPPFRFPNTPLWASCILSKVIGIFHAAITSGCPSNPVSVGLINFLSKKENFERRNCKVSHSALRAHARAKKSWHGGRLGFDRSTRLRHVSANLLIIPYGVEDVSVFSDGHFQLQ